MPVHSIQDSTLAAIKKKVAEVIEALHENNLYEMIGRLFGGRIHSGRYPCNIIVCIKHSYRNEVIVNSMDKLIRKIFGQCSGKNNFLLISL